MPIHFFSSIYYAPTIHCYLYNNIYIYILFSTVHSSSINLVYVGSPIVIAVSNPPGSCAGRPFTLIIKNIYFTTYKVYVYNAHHVIILCWEYSFVIGNRRKCRCIIIRQPSPPWKIYSTKYNCARDSFSFNDSWTYIHVWCTYINAYCRSMFRE